MSDEVYWRIYLNLENKYCVVSLQHFDECNYDQERFLRDERNSKYLFEDDHDYSTGYKSGEKAAQEFLNRVIKPEFIAADDLIVNDEHMFKIPKEEW